MSVPTLTIPKTTRNRRDIRGLDDEELLQWQDVLDEIAAQRPDNLTCPFCGKSPLNVGETPNGRTRIECGECGKFVEGMLQGQ